MTDYKKYSLENLENWLYDAMSCGDATPQEIYDTIIKVVKDEYYTYKKRASESHELLSLLNGNDSISEKGETIFVDGYSVNGESYSDYWYEYDRNDENRKNPFICDKDDPSPECQKSWTNFWEESSYPVYMNEDGNMYIPDYVTKKDQVNRWVLPVQVDGLTGECYVNLPDDLLERAGLKEGDMVHWIDRKDGSFEMRKVNGPE